jgi:hypothetical protein
VTIPRWLQNRDDGALGRSLLPTSKPSTLRGDILAALRFHDSGFCSAALTIAEQNVKSHRDTSHSPRTSHTSLALRCPTGCQQARP